MTEPIFDHDRLDVDRLSIDYVASSFAIAKELTAAHRHAREPEVKYRAGIEYEYRDAEYEYKYEVREKPEL